MEFVCILTLLYGPVFALLLKLNCLLINYFHLSYQHKAKHSSLTIKSPEGGLLLEDMKEGGRELEIP